MSAIWGCVDLSGGPLSSALEPAMREPYESCKIERFAALHAGSAVMGCGIQFVTPQAKNEVLPIWDESENLLFCADCFLDNRESLCRELAVEDAQTPDGTLLFLAYKRWRQDVFAHVLGSYSFAVYDAQRHTLLLAADHTFSRSIYYCRQGNLVFFSTLLEPILRMKEGGAAPDDAFIALFLANINISILTNPVDTAYAGIKRVVASQYMQFDLQSSEAHTYWSPEDVKPLDLPDDEAYKEHFRALFSEIAAGVLRSGGQTGIFLSGGLDSCCTAAATAPELARRGLPLLSYTWIPIKSHEARRQQYYLANEKPEVEKMCALYPNIEPHFMDVPHLDAVTPMARLLDIHETPYKAIGNIPWIEALEAQAAQDGCRVMLTGQYGNNTISNGRADLFVSEMFVHGHFIKGSKALNRYAKAMHLSRKHLFLDFFKSLVPLRLRRRRGPDYLTHSFINRDFAKAQGIDARDERIAFNSREAPLSTLKNTKDLIFYPLLLAQTTDTLTKISLRHGTISRDLTRDIRLIEFCLAAPLTCFADGYATRRMARSYMADCLPADFASETRPMGVQGGDVMERIAPKWAEIRAEMARVFISSQLAPYIDVGKVMAAFDGMNNPPTRHDWEAFTQLGAVYSLGVFLQKNIGR